MPGPPSFGLARLLPPHSACLYGVVLENGAYYRFLHLFPVHAALMSFPLGFRRTAMSRTASIWGYDLQSTVVVCGQDTNYWDDTNKTTTSELGSYRDLKRGGKLVT